MSEIAAAPVCTPASNVTRSLLGYGVLAGPLYVVVSLIQGFTREGFDLTRHAWSLLANGPLGWIHVVNLVLTGLMVVAAAVGARRALGDRRGRKWGPVLLGGYGLGMVGAGVFAADPLGTVEPTLSGMLHFVFGGLGFLTMVGACFVFARLAPGGWAIYSRITGVVFLAAFAGIASGSGNQAVILAFTAAVVAVSVWLSLLSVRLYRI